MKTQLLFLAYLMLSINFFAQQNVWTGTVDDKWSNKENWSGEVPSASDDVLIPSGFVVTIDSPADILSIEVQGNSVLNITKVLKIANPSEFEDNVVVNWSGGDLNGGGILLNSGTINMSFPSFDISESTTLNNPGTINLVAGGVIFINTNSVINNSGTGIIDFKANGTAITKAGGAPNALINDGLIKTSFPNDTDQGFIAAALINRDGVLQVEKGSLNLNNTIVNLQGGMYNVSAGATLNLNSPMTVSGILTGNVFGELNWSNDMSIASTAVFNFSGNNIINWFSGNLIGGGTLTNSTIIDRNGGGQTIISGGTILDNNGEIRLTSGTDIAIGTDSAINNNPSGTIDIKSDGAEIRLLGSAPNVLNNTGLIKTTFPNPSDQSIIWAQLNENGGAIQVESGTLSLNNANSTLTNSVLNISSGAALQWLMPVTVSGNLTGNLEGTLVWDDPLLITSSATFNFSGNGVVDWKSGDLNGGGILTNFSTITKSTGISASILGTTTLNNENELHLTGASDIFIGTGSIINNNANGIIDIKFGGAAIGINGVAPNVLNNFGLIKGNAPTAIATISATVNNSGTIEAALNPLIFSGTLINESSGIIKGVASIELPIPLNFTNNGTFAPGASPGTLNLVGDYSSTASSILDIELNGLTQGSEYDVLSIDGDASFDGDIQIALNFDASINDEFIIASTTGTINSCNLPTTKIVNYNGFLYNFNISCRNSNELVLAISNKTLGIESLENYDKSVTLYPNPTNNIATFSDKHIIKIEVFDIKGRKVLTQNSYSISVKNLSKGIYLVKGITPENISVIKKLVKN